MLRIWTAMIRSEKKGLRISNDRVDPSQRFRSFTYHEALMLLHQVPQPRIDVQSVRLDLATRFQMVFDKRSDGQRIKCPHQLHPHKPSGLLFSRSGHGDQNLWLGCASATFPAFAFPAKVGFAHLHMPLKCIVIILLPHRRTDLLQHGPGNPIADPHFRREGKSGVAALIARYEEQRPEPGQQWRSGPMKDRTRSGRHLIAAALAFIQKPLWERPIGSSLASGTNKSIRPSQPKKVVSAGFFIGKSPMKFGHGHFPSLCYKGKVP